MSARITAVHEDDNGKPSHVIINGIEKRPVETIAGEIKNGRRYHTQENGKHANVNVGHNQNRQFLTTNPDGTTDNNLGELPRK